MANPVLEFKVDDMSCAHCTGTIEQAIKAIDPAATLTFNLERHLVQINSALDAKKLETSIAEAGYMPQLQTAN